jgi:hypothetical protein
MLLNPEKYTDFGDFNYCHLSNRKVESQFASSDAMKERSWWNVFLNRPKVVDP